MSALSGGNLFQNAVYVGINLQNILYGIEIVLYLETVHALLANKAKHTKSDMFYVFFSSVMLFLITVWVSTQAIFGEKMWLLDAKFPGGPSAFWAEDISKWYMDLATTSLVVLQLMTDALMIYRCSMVWKGYRIVIVPSILWIGTLVLGVLVGWSSTASGGIFFHGVSLRFLLAYYTISVFLTAMLTCMICYRIVQYARMMRQHIGREHASHYVAIISIVVESVLPYTLSGITFLVVLGLKSEMLTPFGYVHASLMCVSPQMLILRVASGKAWSTETGRVPSPSVEFSPEDYITSRVC